MSAPLPTRAAGDKPHPTRAFLAALLARTEDRLQLGPMSIVDCHGIPRAELEAVPGFVFCGRGNRSSLAQLMLPAVEFSPSSMPSCGLFHSDACRAGSSRWSFASRPRASL